MTIKKRIEFESQILSLESVVTTTILQSDEVDIEFTKKCNLLIRGTNQKIQILINSIKDKQNANIKKPKVVNIRRATGNLNKPEVSATEVRLTNLIVMQSRVMKLREKIHEHLSRLGIEIL